MKIKVHLATLTCAVALIGLGPSTLTQEKQSLYQRLGGYDVIAAIAHDYFGRIRSDPQFSRFTGGRSQDSLKRARQLLVEQLCALTGGPCVYIGRDMKTAHGGLGITERDWEASMKHLAESIDKQEVRQKEKEELLMIVAAYEKDIVEKSKP
jgi:hemoglobin